MTRPTLIAAVLADPDALWAILTAEVGVMGPWRRTARASERLTADYMDNGYDCAHGSWVRLVQSQRNKHVGWRVVIGGEMKPTARGEWFPTLADAEAWCDEQLRKAGWLLATGVADG